MAKKDNIQVKIPADLPVKVIAAPDAITTEQREREAGLSQKVIAAPDALTVEQSESTPELSPRVIAAPDAVITEQARIAELGQTIPAAPDFAAFNIPERDPDLNVNINAAPDADGNIPLGKPLLPIRLRGGAVTVKESAILPNGTFSMIKNMRGQHQFTQSEGFKQRKGQRVLHDTADSTNKGVSVYQFNKSKVTDDHFLALFSDGDILDADNAPPGIATSAVFGDQVYDGTTSPIPPSWGNIDDTLVFSAGVDQHQIYAGAGTYVEKFIIFKGSGAPPTVPTIGEDFSVEINDGQSSTVAVLDSLGLFSNNECIFICTPVPVNVLTWTIPKPNGTVSTATLYYKKNDNTWEDTSMTDTTKTGGNITLATTGGAMTWTIPTDEQSSYMYGRSGFWYQLRLTVSALDSQVEVSAVTYSAPFQDLRNIWDGVPVDAVEVQVEGATQYYRYAAGSVNLDALGSGKKIVVASADPIEGIYIDPGNTPNATGTAITSLKYWDGNSFEVVGTITDGTGGMSSPGWITFPRKTAYKHQFGTSTFYAYWYEIIWDSAISADTVVSVRTMPYFDMGNFGKVGMCNAVWKGRLIVSFDILPEYIYISAEGRPMVFNGLDFKIKEVGDGRSNKIVSMKKYYNELAIWQEEEGVDGGCLTLMLGNSPTAIGKLLLSTKFGSFNSKSTVVVDGIATTAETKTNPKTRMYFLSNRGFCMSDGQSVTIISDDIQNYFDPQQIECIRTGYENEHWVGYDSAENVIRMGIVSGDTATLPNIFPVYDIVDDAWYFDDPEQGLSCMTEVQAGTGDVAIIQVGGGIDDGFIYQLNYGTNDVSTEIDAFFIIELDAKGYILWITEMLMRVRAQTAGDVLIIPYSNDMAEAQFILTEASELLLTENSDYLVIEPTIVFTKTMTAETAGDMIRRHRFFMDLTDSHISLKFQNTVADQTLYVESVALDIQAMMHR